MSNDVSAEKKPISSSEHLPLKEKIPKSEPVQKLESGQVVLSKTESSQAKPNEKPEDKAPVMDSGIPTSTPSPSGSGIGITLGGNALRETSQSHNSASMENHIEVGRVEVVLYEEGFTSCTLTGTITGRALHGQIYRVLLKEFAQYRARRSGGLTHERVPVTKG